MSVNTRSTSRARGQLLSIQDAAAYLGTSERHLRRLVNERRIPFTKLGEGRMAPLRFDTAKLDRWVDDNSFDPARDESE